MSEATKEQVESLTEMVTSLMLDVHTLVNVLLSEPDGPEKYQTAYRKAYEEMEAMRGDIKDLHRAKATIELLKKFRGNTAH